MSHCVAQNKTMNLDEISSFLTKSEKDANLAATVAAEQIWKVLMPKLSVTVRRNTSISENALPVDSKRKTGRITHNWNLTGSVQGVALAKSAPSNEKADG